MGADRARLIAGSLQRVALNSFQRPCPSTLSPLQATIKDLSTKLDCVEDNGVQLAAERRGGSAAAQP